MSSVPGATTPVVVHRVDPQYTDQARTAQLQGFVVLRVLIVPDGTIDADHIEVLRSLGKGLDEKAIEAVKQWRFKPGAKDGAPIPMQMPIIVRFQLK